MNQFWLVNSPISSLTESFSLLLHTSTMMSYMYIWDCTIYTNLRYSIVKVWILNAHLGLWSWRSWAGQRRRQTALKLFLGCMGWATRNCLLLTEIGPTATYGNRAHRYSRKSGPSLFTEVGSIATLRLWGHRCSRKSGPSLLHSCEAIAAHGSRGHRYSTVTGKVFYRQKPPKGESTTKECVVNYQLIAVIYRSIAKWGTPSCSRPQKATDNGVRDGRSNWLVVPPPSWTAPPERLVHSINRCSLSSTGNRSCKLQHARQPPCLCGTQGIF